MHYYLGLVVGFIVGMQLGGIWTIFAPILGFGIGLTKDRKMFMGKHL